MSTTPDTDGRHVAGPQRVALSAAIGCAFGGLLFLSAEEFFTHLTHEPAVAIGEIVTIAIVAIGVVLFIEPLISQFRINVGLSQAHAERELGRPVMLRLAAFGIIVFASLSDGLLHSYVKSHTAGTIGFALAVAIASYVTTLAWTRGVRRRPSCAAWLGLTGGGATAVVGLLLMAALGGANNMTRQNVELLALLGLLQWGAAGFVGGFIIDRGWSTRSRRLVPIALFVTLTILNVAFEVYAVKFLGSRFAITDILYSMTLSLGWGLGLMLVGPSADAAFRHASPRPGLKSKPNTPPNPAPLSPPPLPEIAG
jgi:hypothetical protein